MASIARINAADSLTEVGNTLTLNDPYLLTMDSNSNTAQAWAILNSIGAPKLGQSHPDIRSLVVIDRSVDHFEGQRKKFIVNINYSNERTSIDRQSNEDPLDLPASYTFDQVDRMVPVTHDAETGKKIANTANQPFSSITENKPLTRITITRNERDYNNSDSEKARNRVNKRSMRIDGIPYAAGTVKLELYAGTKQFDSEGNTFYNITYKLLINEEGFKRSLVNRGTKGIGEDGKLVSAGRNIPKDFEGASYLDADGKFIVNPSAEPIELEFDTLEKADLHLLRL